MYMINQAFAIEDMFGKKHMICTSHVGFIADAGDFTKICVDGYVIKTKESYKSVLNKFGFEVYV